MLSWFKPLLSLQVLHGYYEGVCADVGFVVPSDVAQRLRGFGLRARVDDGAFQISYASDETGAPRRSAAGLRVRVGLVIRAVHFTNITEGFDPAAGAFYYRNAAQPDRLDALPTRVILLGSTLSRSLARDTRPVTCSLEASDGQRLSAETRAVGDTRAVASFDLAGVAPGRYDFSEQYGNGTVRTPLFIDRELLASGVFGIVELDIQAAFHATPPTFSLSFQARLEPQRYYVVLAKGFSAADIDQLAVRDLGFGDPERPDEVVFAKVAAADLSSDERAQTTLLAADGGSVLLFRSSQSIARRARARKRIQLVRNGEALIENLPQPGRDRGSADLVVLLSKSKP